MARAWPGTRSPDGLKSEVRKCLAGCAGAVEQERWRKA